MPEISLRINGHVVRVPSGTTVAGVMGSRRSDRTPPTPLCGMGICFQCRVTIDGTPHRLACQTLCRDGMEVRTG